jgi:hypothetical protein
VNKRDGKTEEVSRRRKKRVPVHQREGLGAIPVQSEINGVEPSGFGSKNSKGRDTTWSNILLQQGDHPLGKILKRLELLEKAFESYVGSHRQRLEARLDENKDFVNTFERQLQLLKEEIYNLAAQSNEEQSESES